MPDQLSYSAQNSRRFIRDLPDEDQPINRLYHAGAKALSNSELLAIMLQSPDALDVAQEVLMLCDGIHNLARYDARQFTTITGIGPAQAARLVAVAEVGCRLVSPPYETERKVSSPALAANLILTNMRFKSQEELVVILLNARNIVIDIVTVCKGSVSSIAIRIADVLRPAILLNANSMIMAHNHPSGDPSPSPEDVRITREVRKAADLVGIDLLDHIITGGESFVSLKERGLGFD